MGANYTATAEFHERTSFSTLLEAERHAAIINRIQHLEYPFDWAAYPHTNGTFFIRHDFDRTYLKVT